jgi:hypothetical protein
VFDTRTEMSDMMLSSVPAEPVLEPGTSRISVQVYGRIQLN